MQCFLMLHLFGYSVRWVAPSYRPEIVEVSDKDLTERCKTTESF